MIRNLGARFACCALAVLSACGGASSQGAWSAAGQTPEARLEASVARVGRRLYHVGGIRGIGGVAGIGAAEPTARVDVLDLDTGTWSLGPQLPAEAPKHHLALEVVGDRIFVFGGFDGILNRPGDVFRPSATSWVLEGGAWRRLADAPLARGGATARHLGGVVYVVGGAPTEGEPSYGDLYAYDLTRDAWSARAPMPTPREHVTSCALDGKMLVAGGWSADRRVVAAAEAYDPATDRWERLPDLPTARGGLAAATLGGRCFVVGGERWDVPPPGTFAVNEAFDFASRKWTRFAPMPTARHGFGLVVVDGALWAIGGGPAQGNTYTTAIERFAPSGR